MQPDQPDLINTYIHKTVDRRRPGVNLKFVTSQSLFSSNTIDPGTNLLLRTIGAHAGRTFESCLDIGCGYGPIGASLLASGIAKRVDMADRDALAVELARRNVELNSLENINAFASLGYDDVPTHDYDLIVSNLPGKAGETVLRHLLMATADHLAANGQVWIVVVPPLLPLVEDVLSESGAETLHVEHGTRHSVYGFRPVKQHDSTAGDSVAAGIYHRNVVQFLVGDRNLSLETSRGVEEFDGLNYSTRLLLEQLYVVRNRRLVNAALFNVGQGYVPVAVRAARISEGLELLDRDLLALRTSGKNLQENDLHGPAIRFHHEVGWTPPGNEAFGLIAGTLRGDEPQEAVDKGAALVLDRLEPGGIAMIAGASTAITRMVKSTGPRKDIIMTDRQRYRGSSVVVITKKDSA